MTPATTSTIDREIVISRLFSYPREFVFAAWTDPAHLIQWWGPQGFTNTFEEIEVKPGGVWKFIMHGPDGVDYPNHIVFDEIRPPEYIAYTHGSGVDDPAPFQSIITFTEREGKTEITMRGIFPTPEARDYVIKEFHAIEGGRQTLECLNDYLATL